MTDRTRFWLLVELAIGTLVLGIVVLNLAGQCPGAVNGRCGFGLE